MIYLPKVFLLVLRRYNVLNVVAEGFNTQVAGSWLPSFFVCTRQDENNENCMKLDDELQINTV